MFIYAFMTYRFHGQHMFDKMSIMVRPCLVNLLPKFCMDIFVFVSFIVLESFIKFWVVTWSLSLKRWHIFHDTKHETMELRLQSLPCRLMNVTIGFQSHGCWLVHVSEILNL